MKKLLTLIFFSAFAFQASAQIQEPVLPPMTNYSISTPPPIYTSSKMKVFENGRGLSRTVTRNLFQGTPAYDVYNKAVRYNRIGSLLWPGVGISGFGALFVLMSAAYTIDGYAYESVTLELMGIGFGIMAVGLPFIATGIVFKVRAKRTVAQAVGMYNDYLASSAGNYLPEITLGVTPGGLGVVYRF